MAATLPRGFQTPKVYDPTAAERQPTVGTIGGTSHQQHMKDLGFEEDASPQHGGRAGIGDFQERYREQGELVEDLRRRIRAMEEELSEVKASDARSTQKLQSFQQVNRSQTTLMKAELQKTRKKLGHMQAVAARLREQAAWLQSSATGAVLPHHLQGLPSEEEACSTGEGEEWAKMTQKWENDIVQLQAILVRPDAEAFIGGGQANLQVADMSRVKELEALVEKQKKDLQSLRGGGGVLAAATGDAGGDVARLQQELEVSEEKAKDQQKKLKQLATAYKKIEQEKKDLEAAAGGGRRGGAVSAAVLARVREGLAASRAEARALREEVATSLTANLPALLEEAMRGKMPELQNMVDAGSKEWREKYNVECDRRRKLHNMVQELKGNIRVYCRVRPLAAHESGSCISFPALDEIQIRNEDTGTKKAWQFNEVFRENSSQTSVFEGVRDLVVSMLDGYNVCIFAYGQTGSGKTHSMQGTPDNPGIYTRTFNELFKVAKERHGWKIELKGALVEVYNEEIRDLLSDPSESRKQKLAVKQGKDGNHVPGLSVRPLAGPADVEEMLRIGSQNRTVAATDMNMHSSRSHLLVQIFGSITTPQGKASSSTITLVDLAGSERLAKSGVTGDRAKEAIAINKSLSALGDVINARASKSGHTPFRNSTLTHLLQDSLSGDSKTLMLLQINPCADHVDESQCSLQFGARVNNVEMSKK